VIKDSESKFVDKRFKLVQNVTLDVVG